MRAGTAGPRCSADGVEGDIGEIKQPAKPTTMLRPSAERRRGSRSLQSVPRPGRHRARRQTAAPAGLRRQVHTAGDLPRCQTVEPGFRARSRFSRRTARRTGNISTRMRNDEGEDIRIVATEKHRRSGRRCNGHPRPDQPEQHAAGHGAGKVADAMSTAAKRLEPEHETHLVMRNLVIVADHDAGQRCQCRDRSRRQRKSRGWR